MQFQYSSAPDQLIFLLQLVISMLLGAMIGLDREVADKPAGLRTHMLVAGAATLLVPLGELIAQNLTNTLGEQAISTDPVRIIAAIITGVSFLGAGTIIRRASEQDVEGLTTAASLLFVSVVGISVALSQWILAVGSTVLILIVLRVLPFFERILSSND
jgi:putative Mg2+ transporter-C (MgtC) family protein